jgi:hypothetical protein
MKRVSINNKIDKTKKIKKRRVIITVPKKSKVKKLQKVKKKKVRHNDTEDRFWKDDQERTIKKGKFSSEEVEMLKVQLVEYALENGMEQEELFRRMTSKGIYSIDYGWLINQLVSRTGQDSGAKLQVVCPTGVCSQSRMFAKDNSTP